GNHLLGTVTVGFYPSIAPFRAAGIFFAPKYMIGIAMPSPGFLRFSRPGGPGYGARSIRMNTLRIPLRLAALTLGPLLLLDGLGQDTEPAQNPPEPRALARGPLHEASADPTEAQPHPSPVVTRKPPDPVDEMPPDQKPEGDDVQWIPG